MFVTDESFTTPNWPMKQIKVAIQEKLVAHVEEKEEVAESFDDSSNMADLLKESDKRFELKEEVKDDDDDIIVDDEEDDILKDLTADDDMADLLKEE